MARTDNLEDLLFVGISERPIWSGFLQELARKSCADRAVLTVEGSSPDASALAIVSPDLTSIEEIAQSIRFDQLLSLPFAHPQRISTHRGEAIVIRCEISGARSIWLSVEGAHLNTKACLGQLNHIAPLLGRILPLYEHLAATDQDRILVLSARRLNGQPSSPCATPHDRPCLLSSTLNGSLV